MTRTCSLAVVLAACLTSACGSGSSSTPLSPPAASTDASAGTDGARGIEISGAVSRIGGTCPAIRLLVGRVTVQTGRATAYTGGSCASLASGVTVVVRGSRQADGSLAASTIVFRGSPSR